jgi:hypothetical protein
VLAILVSALIIAAAVVWVVLTRTRPAYDAWGWMVWGRQTLKGALNTSAAPSWKALPYLFTLPYALFGRTQQWLWTGTASAFAIGGWVLAARLAYRLSRDYGSQQSRWPSLFAGALGFLAVPSLYGMWHQMLIANSDPMVVTLMLAAIDLYLSRRHRWAVLMLVLATLGRPEAVTFLGLYALALLIWGNAGDRTAAVLGVLAVPLGWFLAPALSSKSWFQAGDLAEGFRTAIVTGSKIGTVIYRFDSLYAGTVWIAAAVGAIWAILRRDLTWIALIVCSLLWVVVEIGFAYHGWPAAPRYLMEPAAVLGMLAAAMIGRVLRYAVTVGGHALARLAALAAVLAATGTLVPVAVARVDALTHDIHRQQPIATRIDRLSGALASVGGAAAIQRCAPPFTFVGDASLMAWQMGLNVGDIGYKWKRVFGEFRPTVYVRPVGRSRWRIDAYNIPRARLSACGRIPVLTQAPTAAQRRRAALWLRFRQWARAERRRLHKHPLLLRRLLQARWHAMLVRAHLAPAVHRPHALRHRRSLRRRHHLHGRHHLRRGHRPRRGAARSHHRR